MTLTNNEIIELAINGSSTCTSSEYLFDPLAMLSFARAVIAAHEDCTKRAQLAWDAGQPVAWLVGYRECHVVVMAQNQAEKLQAEHGGTITPLYAAPPAAAPVWTDDMLAKVKDGAQTIAAKMAPRSLLPDVPSAPPAAANQAGIPEGWKLVPEQPTPEMIAMARWHDGEHTALAVWDDMLAASPHPTESHALGGGDTE